MNANVGMESHSEIKILFCLINKNPKLRFNLSNKCLSQHYEILFESQNHYLLFSRNLLVHSSLLVPVRFVNFLIPTYIIAELVQAVFLLLLSR